MAHPLPLSSFLDRIESAYGRQQAHWPTDPYEFIVWWHCGYPASDARCASGWAALTRTIGFTPKAILAARPSDLAAALKKGGMVPELRALRLKEIAQRVQDQLGGDLRSALTGRMADARKTLKSFPNIADPGADRILLFAGLSPVAAVPSNCPHVAVRMLHGMERESYSVTYREAQLAISEEVAETVAARQRAYLLLKQHGQQTCKLKKPLCEGCAVASACAFFAGHHRARGKPAATGSRR